MDEHRAIAKRIECNTEIVCDSAKNSARRLRLTASMENHFGEDYWDMPFLIYRQRRLESVPEKRKR
jgi:hypothetical protein